VVIKLRYCSRVFTNENLFMQNNGRKGMDGRGDARGVTSNFLYSIKVMSLPKVLALIQSKKTSNWLRIEVCLAK
jgi:hypothetical protein